MKERKIIICQRYINLESKNCESNLQNLVTGYFSLTLLLDEIRKQMSRGIYSSEKASSELHQEAELVHKITFDA